MRSILLAGCATAITGAMTGAPLLAQTQPARPVVQADETILRVAGEGAVKAAPSVMEVTIGVVTTGATAAEALEANNRKLAPVLAMLRERGIPASDIRTSDLEVEARYVDPRGAEEDRIIGFRASNFVTVTSRDLDGAGELVSALFDAGANTIDGPVFTVAEDEREALTRVAEADALREARAQAENTAEALGLRVSRVLLVSDSTVRFTAGSRTIIVTGSRISRTPIEPGEVEVTAQYNVEFALGPQ